MTATTRTSDDTDLRPSVCPLDCPDTCSLDVGVRDGRVVQVRGSSVNPYTAGVICNKVARYYPEFVHGSARLQHPLVRTGERGGNGFAPVSWDEALQRVHEGLATAIDRHGPQSVLPFNYAGPHGQLAGGSMDRRFFHRLGASLLDRGPLCGIVRGTAYTSLFGAAPGMAPEGAAEADLIAVWGNNVTVSNLHLARVIKAARDKGARLVVVDPKRTRIAELADLFVQPRPGTDVVLAFALAAELERRGAFDLAFIDRWVRDVDAYMAVARQWSAPSACDECGIEPDAFEALLQAYMGAKRLSLSVGNGIERGRNGGSALRAIMALNVLLGQLGRPGAGIFAKPGLAAPLTGNRLQRPDLVPPGTRTINIVDVGRLLLDRSLDPPIAALFIYNHNPVCTHPDQNRLREGLRRDDLFVVGSDVVMTDSMRYADVILPACSHFEHDDVFGAYGQNYLQRARPVIEPVGEALPNTEIFRRLAARFGFQEPALRASDDELMDDAVDADDPRLAGTRGRDLPLSLEMRAGDGTPLRMCDNVAPATGSGRIELMSESLERAWGCGLPRYERVRATAPLVLISPSSDKRTNATFGADPASAGLERLEIHPTDAAARGIADGAIVRAFNGRGEVHLRARISQSVRAGVVYSPKGCWLATSPTGQTVNALMDADLRTDICSGACYNDTFVEVALA
ncbi:MAG: molybdopterin-dependent oxidoreductase [Burkholderiaceae bacterium]